jgi:hypothetical protein
VGVTEVRGVVLSGRRASAGQQNGTFLLTPIILEFGTAVHLAELAGPAGRRAAWPSRLRWIEAHLPAIQVGWPARVGAGHGSARRGGADVGGGGARISGCYGSGAPRSSALPR